MLKVKHERDCDCVVAGFRWHKNGGQTIVGSLLLGLYNAGGSCSMWDVARALRRRSGGSWWSFWSRTGGLPEGASVGAVGAESAEGAGCRAAKSRWTGARI